LTATKVDVPHVVQYKEKVTCSNYMFKGNSIKDVQCDDMY